MKRLLAVPVCALVTARMLRWPYWFSVLSVARSLWQPPMRAEQEADYLA